MTKSILLAGGAIVSTLLLSGVSAVAAGPTAKAAVTITKSSPTIKSVNGSAVKVSVLNKNPGKSGRLANVSALNGKDTSGRSAVNVSALNGSSSSRGTVANVSVLNGGKGRGVGAGNANLGKSNGSLVNVSVLNGSRSQAGGRRTGSGSLVDVNALNGRGTKGGNLIGATVLGNGTGAGHTTPTVIRPTRTQGTRPAKPTRSARPTTTSSGGSAHSHPARTNRTHSHTSTFSSTHTVKTPRKTYGVTHERTTTISR